MDLSFDAVASKCAHQMAQYQQCVYANQNGDWAKICREQGKALTKCADENVPHLAALKQACFKHIEAYRGCLEKNGAERDEVIAERCSSALKTLWECTDAQKEKLMAESR